MSNFYADGVRVHTLALLASRTFFKPQPVVDLSELLNFCREIWA